MGSNPEHALTHPVWGSNFDGGNRPHNFSDNKKVGVLARPDTFQKGESMKDINSVTLTGRLTDNMQLRYLNSGTPIGKFSLAVNRTKKVNGQYVDSANFFECALFGKAAESLNNYMTKGKQVGITGELRQERWTSDGVNYSRVVLVVNDVVLLGVKEQQKSTSQKQAPPQKQSYNNQAGPENFADDEIPF